MEIQDKNSTRYVQNILFCVVMFKKYRGYYILTLKHHKFKAVRICSGENCAEIFITNLYKS
jgi:hypothetical protein